MGQTSQLGVPPAGYLRFPSIAGDLVAFVTEDDLWTADVAGRPARRITADLAGKPTPSSPLMARTWLSLASRRARQRSMSCLRAGAWHGVDPDEEVLIAPQDYAMGRDPQLERAIELVSEALASFAPTRPDMALRPAKSLPDLPPRGADRAHRALQGALGADGGLTWATPPATYTVA